MDYTEVDTRVDAAAEFVGLVVENGQEEWGGRELSGHELKEHERGDIPGWWRGGGDVAPLTVWL